MTPLVQSEGVTTSFGTTRALDGLDLTIPTGQLVALLGPNGAGKTTFVRTLATLSRPDAGSARVLGHDVVREAATVRRLVGLAGQQAAVEPTLTGRENLELVARLFGHRGRTARRHADAVLERLDLVDAATRSVGGYSGGMRRRLDLGASLVGAPRLLLLDEPTTGLDPASRLGLWDLIASLVAAGTDVLLTTQYLEEADRLADRIVVVDRGRVVADGTPTELKQREVGSDVIEVHLASASDALRAAEVLAPIGRGEPAVDAATRSVSVAVDGGHRALVDVVRLLDEAGVDPDDLTLRRPTLDEVFLALTTGGARA